jgi:hypothetical protein
MRAYPIWAIILLVLGWAIVAATLLHAVDFLLPVVTGDIYGRGVFMAAAGAVAMPGIAIGLALIAIAGEGRRDGKTGRWKLWAKLLFLLGATICICIPLLILAAGQFASIFAEILLFFGWIPILFGALMILAALFWGGRKQNPDVVPSNP